MNGWFMFNALALCIFDVFLQCFIYVTIHQVNVMYTIKYGTYTQNLFKPILKYTHHGIENAGLIYKYYLFIFRQIKKWKIIVYEDLILGLEIFNPNMSADRDFWFGYLSWKICVSFESNPLKLRSNLVTVKKIIKIWNYLFFY